MKKTIVIILISLISLILIDTLLALVFNNNPIFKVRANYDGGTIYYIDKGIFVDTYKCVNGKKDTVIKGFSYTCEEVDYYKIVDTSKEIKDFSCDSALEKIYEDDNYTYYLNCIKSNYIKIRYNGGKEENIKYALENGHISIKDLDKFDIDYIKYEK